MKRHVTPNKKNMTNYYQAGLTAGVIGLAASIYIYSSNVSTPDTTYEQVKKHSDSYREAPGNRNSLMSFLPKQNNHSDEQGTDSVSHQTPQTWAQKPFAPSIEDTEIDGSLKADGSGNLIVDLEVKDLFDYFMDTVADVPSETALAELEKLAREHLPEKAANQAMALLNDYLAYKHAALEISGQTLIPSSQQTPAYRIMMLESAFRDLKTVRRQTMSEEAVEAFFGLEEAYGQYTLEVMRTQSNPNLSDAEKQQQIAMHRDLLPELLRQSEESMLEESQKQKQISEIMNQNLPEEELAQALEKEGLNPESIKDAVDYMVQQERFDTLYKDYKTERDRLKAYGLSETDLEMELAALQQRIFKTESMITQAKIRDLRS